MIRYSGKGTRMKKTVFQLARLFIMATFVTITMTGCGRKTDIPRETTPVVHANPSPEPTPTPKATAEEIADKKKDMIQYAKSEWERLVKLDWVEQMKRQPTDACFLGERYHNFGYFSDKLSFYTKDSVRHELKFQDIGITREQYQTEHKKAGVAYLQALITAFQTNNPPSCAGGEGQRYHDSQFEIVQDIVSTLQYSKDDETGNFLLTPADIGVSQAGLRAMARQAIKNEATKKKPDKNVIYAGLKEWNFTPEEIGITKERAREFIEH